MKNLVLYTLLSVGISQVAHAQSSLVGSDEDSVLEIIGFEVHQKNGYTVVNWETKPDADIKSIEVLGSTNGDDWMVLSTMPGPNGGFHNVLDYASVLEVHGEQYFVLKLTNHTGESRLTTLRKLPLASADKKQPITLTSSLSSNHAASAH